VNWSGIGAAIPPRASSCEWREGRGENGPRHRLACLAGGRLGLQLAAASEAWPAASEAGLGAKSCCRRRPPFQMQSSRFLIFLAMVVFFAGDRYPQAYWRIFRVDTKMLEGFFRGGVLLVVGLAIGLAAIWYLSIVYQQIFGTTQIVIDQFVLIRKESEADDKLGTALAQMLQARLQALGSELQEAQAGLTANASPSRQRRDSCSEVSSFLINASGSKRPCCSPLT
jgi:hypothetical protein